MLGHEVGREMVSFRQEYSNSSLYHPCTVADFMFGTVSSFRVRIQAFSMYIFNMLHLFVYSFILTCDLENII